jgi:molybdopterin-containing oxidoreductase family iron-sulfur binding subunit
MEDKSKRDFLKVSGICALGLSALPIARSVAKAAGPVVEPNPKALVAKKWAMVVDMKKCWEKAKPGCKDCMLACHVTHNVPDIGTTKEEIKWIWSEDYENVFTDQAHPYTAAAWKDIPVLVLCNHCTQPPCVKVCPTEATWRRPQDGIVMMDMHRCIGCRYCIAACPYGARSFNWRDPRPYLKTIRPEYPTRTTGVVEKCNFCDERLREGREPACVEAARAVPDGEGALVFGNLADPESEVSRLLREQYTICRRPSLGTGPSVFYIV